MTTARTNALAWTEGGTRLFLDQLNRVRDDDFAGPTSLPDWTTAHLVAHVHFNAQALRRLVAWAATGIENPMYASTEQRAAEVEEGASMAPARLRDLVAGSASALAEDLAALDDPAWDAEVLTAQGRTIPASQIPWLRAREVMVHAVDLGAGLTFADLPTDFTAELLADVVRKRTAAGEGPALATWLTGRAVTPPTLGHWL